MSRKKTTIYVEEDLLCAAKALAVRAGKEEYEVFEEALRSYLGFDILEKAWKREGLPDEEEAMRLGVRRAACHEGREARDHRGTREFRWVTQEAVPCSSRSRRTGLRPHHLRGHEWLAEDPAYDKEVLPELKEALDGDRLGYRKLFE